MFIRFRIATALSLILSLAAGTAAQMPDADMKELSSYRLTMETVNKVQSATRVMIAELKKDPKFQVRQKLQAEVESLEKKDELTEAEQQRVEALKEQIEKMDDEDFGIMNGAKSLDEMEARMKRSAPLMRGLQQAAMPPREYAKFMMAMVQAAMVAGFKKSGMKEIPPGINPENVKFVEEHEAELKAMQQEMEKLIKPGGE
jgi:hypothetical protein